MKTSVVAQPHIRLDADGQRGTATLTAVLILGLLAMFAAASLSRTTSEAVVMSNDYSNTQAFYAAQASLELMSRNFNRIFDIRLRPTPGDIANLQNTTPNIPGFTFVQNVQPTGVSEPSTIEDGPYSGLISIREPWRLDATATYGNGAQVQLTRTFYNHQIPIFQFGIFYNDDMEFHPGPRLDFGGRVHSNRHIFVAAQTGLYFRSRVTAAGEVVHDVAKNGKPFSYWGDNVFVARPGQTDPATFPRVSEGSVIDGPDVNNNDPDVPNGRRNNNWDTFAQRFGGNLLARQRPLLLPLQIGSASDAIEIVKRGLPTDDAVLAGSRYYNMPGVRITLSDSQDRLPGGTGGRRLDGAADGLGGPADTDGTRGYWPPAMAGAVPYRATRFNGHRLYTGPSYTDAGAPAQRETWVKVEIVRIDETTLSPVTTDVTEDFLSLGLTHQDPRGLNIGDSRAILKMQRYEVYGPPVKVADVNGGNDDPAYTTAPGGLRYYGYDTTRRFSYVSTDEYSRSRTEEMTRHQARRTATVNVGGTPTSKVLVPFPIKMFDTREGLFNDDLNNAEWNSFYPNSSVPAAGVMSVIDIDIANFRQLVSGAWDGLFPSGRNLSTLIPNDDGWIVYVSDRRGDRNNDGYYAMEDIFGPKTNPNDGVLQPGEDLDRDGVLDVDHTWEAPRYNVAIPTDEAAVFDERYYRRAVRLINGSQLPGNETKGLTVASENGLYILGNYNATGIVSYDNPTRPENYLGPQSPASVVADAITILSNNWNDGKSFRRPFTTGPSGDSFNGRRVVDTSNPATDGETSVRAAFLMGDTLTAQYEDGQPSQGGGDPRMSGGVHNFPRFMEVWTGVRLNYCGSLINLFNSRVNNGAFKCCAHVYSPPVRNWTFDTSFYDANRLPPGTPFFQFVQMTGFRQTTRQLQ